MAKELADAGLNVVALERGVMRDTATDGAYPTSIDELTYNVRKKLFLNLSRETVSIRHTINDTASPYRVLGAFLPGEGVGGAGLHWSGVHFRVDPVELRLKSHYTEKYGAQIIPNGMTIQDFGVSYEELEPYFDFAEKVFGTSGSAWSVKGQVVGNQRIEGSFGGNFFSPDRSSEFPLAAQKNTVSAQLWGKPLKVLVITPITCLPRIHLDLTPIRMVAKWVLVTFAGFVAAMPVITTQKHLLTSIFSQRCVYCLTLS